METKLSQLLDLMAAEDWQRALAMAAKFPRLCQYRKAITEAHEAFTYPDFYRQIHKDPEVLITAGIIALQEYYAAPMVKYQQAKEATMAATELQLRLLQAKLVAFRAAVQAKRSTQNVSRSR
jgi:hypothetical protein